MVYHEINKIILKELCCKAELFLIENNNRYWLLTKNNYNKEIS